MNNDLVIGHTAVLWCGYKISVATAEKYKTGPACTDSYASFITIALSSCDTVAILPQSTSEISTLLLYASTVLTLY